MKIIRNFQDLNHNKQRAVTIGNFDGVHLGHQQIIKHLIKQAKKQNLISTLISFSPTPQEFFKKNIASLSSFKEKNQLLSALELDEHIVIKFDKTFMQVSAQDFVQNILIKQLNIKYCLIGDDFCFGKNRLGDFNLLKNFNFAVEQSSSIDYKKQRISSSKIRETLSVGDFSLAHKMLGREFSITGEVVHGKKQGRLINFPTININIKRKISPVLGVFAVEVKLQEQLLQGVCNIGLRPTIGGKNILLEVFIFDFDNTVYGQCAQVIFKHKIRNEQKFSSLSDLQKQIQIDVKNAKSYFLTMQN